MLEAWNLVSTDSGWVCLDAPGVIFSEEDAVAETSCRFTARFEGDGG